MRKQIYFLVFVFSLVLSSSLFSQTGWLEITSGTFENLKGVSFPANNTAFLAGNAGLLRYTTDGGFNWSNSTFPVSTANSCVFFTNSITGYVGNANQKVYKTTNGCQSWVEQTTGSPRAVTSIHFSSANTGWLGDYWGDLQKTTNGGLNWNIVSIMNGYNSKVFFISDDYGWVIDNYGYVRRTTNSGNSYSSVRISTDTLSGLHFVSSSLGYVCGDSGRVFKTSNGGLNWTLLNTGVTNKLNAIFALSPTKVIAVGNNGMIIETANGGSNWNSQVLTTVNLNSISFTSNGSYGLICGDNGKLLRTYSFPGSGCIGSENTPAGYPFYTYYMDSKTDMLYTAQEIIAAGNTSEGNILKLGYFILTPQTQIMNGFKIFMQNTSVNNINSFTETGWYQVFDGSYAVPGSGLQYIDLQYPFYWDGVSNILIRICFNNSSYTQNSTVASTSSAGRVYHQHQDLTTGDGCEITTGQTQANRPNLCMVFDISTGTGNNPASTPDKFYLSQNYPNPFNPTTNIKYQTPKNSFVTLKVYNILGKEVATLVNDNKPAGFYTVAFNASSLSSGVYFYKISAGEFTDVKRMILVK